MNIHKFHMNSNYIFRCRGKASKDPNRIKYHESKLQNAGRELKHKYEFNEEKRVEYWRKMKKTNMKKEDFFPKKMKLIHLVNGQVCFFKYLNTFHITNLFAVVI